MFVSDDEEVESPLPAADQAKQEGGRNYDEEEDMNDAPAMDAA